ncbi:MAG: ERAP1-like C-terminal domain-containing protein, partial [Myxococcales bacterium]|nr:ERAP1-like C-terminal domain-containing protein [Myxococcales bacterium]
AGWRDLPEAMRGEVLAIAVNASAPVFQRLLGEVQTEPDRTRRRELFTALATVSDVTRQRTVLALLLDPKVDIRETQWMLFQPNREANRAVAQQFFQDHKDEILERIPSEGTASGQALLAFVFTQSCEPARREEIASYAMATFAKMDGGIRIVQQAVEAMDQCIARRGLVEPAIRAWLGKP